MPQLCHRHSSGIGGLVYTFHPRQFGLFRPCRLRTRTDVPYCHDGRHRRHTWRATSGFDRVDRQSRTSGERDDAFVSDIRKAYRFA